MTARNRRIILSNLNDLSYEERDSQSDDNLSSIYEEEDNIQNATKKLYFNELPDDFKATERCFIYYW